MQTTKPSKQRKRLFQAANHRRHKQFAAPLSPELKTSHGFRALPVRSGDSVRIMRGDQKGFEGKVTRIDQKKYRIHVEGFTREKVDGTTIFVPIHPSKVMITRLNLDDKWRKKILERKKEAHKKIEETIEEKPLKEAIETKTEITKEEIALEKKTPARKPRRARTTATKKTAGKKEEKRKKAKKEETGKEEKPKKRRTKAKRKTTRKTKGET